jgi:hypothetical protein
MRFETPAHTILFLYQNTIRDSKLIQINFHAIANPIPSKHAERKITIGLHKHSFAPYPSLSPYRQMDRMTDRETNTFTVRGLEECFFSWAVVSVFFLAGNRFWCYLLTYLEYNTVVALC